MRSQLVRILERKARSFVTKWKSSERHDFDESVERKLRLFQNRGAKIVKCYAKGQILRKHKIERQTEINYIVHYQFLIKQQEWMYLEEQVEARRALFYDNELIEDQKVSVAEISQKQSRMIFNELNMEERVSYQYDRFAAVRYAETWWNSYNPAFKKFEVDCTNFVSQCLYAGGIPMTGYPNRAKGWWMKNNSWSYSWAVAHLFRWYLSGAKMGLKAIEVPSPKRLAPGDVICYDFQGDGRFDHSTIVVAKDKEGMPLVNAHTSNSRMRYWSYEDSTAYTPNIKYKFFHIVDSL